MSDPNLNELKKDFDKLSKDFDELRKDFDKLSKDLWDHLDTVKLIKSDLQKYYKEQLELKDKYNKDLENRKKIRRFLFSLFQLKCLRKEVKE